MKVVIAVHGFPPELVGGTEASAQATARELARRGHEAIVVSGTLQAASQGAVELETSIDRDPRTGVETRVVRVRRGDLYCDHWHKSLAPAVTAAWRDLLRRERPDVVHVEHWIRLSRDLVLAAARERVPSVVSLHDAWTSCPIAFRVRPDTLEPCDAPVGPHPCIRCAAQVGPRTPWIRGEQAFIALAERQRDLAREIELSRAWIVPSRGHLERLARHGLLRADDRRVHELAPLPPPTAADLGASAPIEPLGAPAELGRLVLGVWGHLMPHKGQDLVLDALDRCADADAIELRFAGAPADPAFARKLRDRAADRRVRFHGAYDRASFATHPAAAVHAAVFASRADESYSLTLDEARALDVVPLTPDRGALGERAESAGATTYRSGDAGALAAIWSSWLRDPSPWRAARSRVEQARAGCARTPWIERVEAIYAEAVAAGAPSVREAEWFEARIAQEFVDGWDRACRAAAEPSR